MTITSPTRQGNWRRKHLKRYQAHLTVQRALKRGDLVKGPCQDCGKTDGIIDGHHFDYSQPLAVIWLCRRCHTLLHKRRGRP